MQVEKVQYDDIKKGDFIVRIARFGREFFTQTGVAVRQDTLEMPYGIIRHYWYSGDGQTLSYVDRDTDGSAMDYFPEDYEQFQRVTL